MTPQTHHIAYGKVEYDINGHPICHICGKGFKKVLSHVVQKHGITAYEYKRMFGLDTTKGIVCNETKVKLQEAVERHYHKVVTSNLLSNGASTRFKKGSEGRTIDMCSEQTLSRLKIWGKISIQLNGRNRRI